MNDFFEKYKIPIKVLSIIAFAILAFLRWSKYFETKSTISLIGGIIWVGALIFGVSSLVELIKERNKTN
jgi:hypothetical protein